MGVTRHLQRMPVSVRSLCLLQIWLILLGIYPVSASLIEPEGIGSIPAEALPLQSLKSLPTSLRVEARNIIFAGTATTSTSTQSTSPLPTWQTSSTIASDGRSSSVPTQSQSFSSYPSSAANSTDSGAPFYSIETPKSGGSDLKYLYLIFLIFVAIIVGLVAWFIVKRRRARRLREQDYIRSEALRLDLQRRRPQTPQMTETTRKDEDLVPMPPPSYPEAALTKRYRLPIYEDLEAEAQPGAKTNAQVQVLSSSHSLNSSSSYGLVHASDSSDSGPTVGSGLASTSLSSTLNRTSPRLATGSISPASPTGPGSSTGPTGPTSLTSHLQEATNSRGQNSRANNFDFEL